jgi:hypothetical protein
MAGVQFLISWSDRRLSYLSLGDLVYGGLSGLRCWSAPGIRPHREDRSAWQVEISVSVASRLLAGRDRVGEGRVLTLIFVFGDKK